MLSIFQAVLLGLVQGISELFPISALGHTVLVANLFNWHGLTHEITASQSAMLQLMVATQLAVAIAIILFYRRQCLHLIKGFSRSFHTRDITHDSNARLAWTLVAAAVPAGLLALVFEYPLRRVFATGFFAIVLVIVNGILLVRGDSVLTQTELNRPRRRRSEPAAAADRTARQISDHLSFDRAGIIGLMQTGALLAGLSRTGIIMLAALRSGLGHREAARFSFLLTALLLLGGGLYKLPTLFASASAALRPQLLLGAIIAGVSAYCSVRFLDAYFQRKSLRPFGIYCIAAGSFLLLISIIRGAS